MGFHIDFYKSYSAGSIYVGCDSEFVNADSIFEKILLRLSGTQSGKVRITLHENMPQEIISKINATFGGVYSESDDGYAAVISKNGIDVYSTSRRGMLYGCYALLREGNDGHLNCGLLYNYPKIKTRAVKVFLPSAQNIEFFKSFAEYCSFYGCNMMMIEVGGAMEYKKHPEVNEGWEEYCKIFEEYQGKTIDVQHSFGWHKNSIHFENGGGSYLSQEQVRDIVSFCRELAMEVIPEVPCLSHSDYLLTRHPELAERKEDPLPNTYCPSNPDTYKLLFDILDETIDVFEPNVVNIAHDEYYSIGLCEKCRHKNAADLYAGDINKIYDYLQKRGIKTMMWGDKLLNAISREENHYGGSLIEYKDSKGNEYTVPATYQAIDKIPNDIRILNWYWRIKREFDKDYLDKGFDVMYANFRPMQIFDCKERMDGKISGYCISNWSSLDPAHIQRNGIFAGIAYAANMFWNHDFDENDFINNFINTAQNIYKYHYEIAQKQKYAYIIHTTTEVRPHKEFVDGYLMDYDSDRLGIKGVHEADIAGIKTETEDRNINDKLRSLTYSQYAYYDGNNALRIQAEINTFSSGVKTYDSIPSYGYVQDHYPYYDPRMGATFTFSSDRKIATGRFKCVKYIGKNITDGVYYTITCKFNAANTRGTIM